jgi:hypothetical protein
MKMYGVTEVHIHGFSAMAVYRGQWSASHPKERTPNTSAIGEFVHVTAGPEAVKKRNLLPLWRIEPQSLCDPARDLFIIFRHPEKEVNTRNLTETVLPALHILMSEEVRVSRSTVALSTA